MPASVRIASSRSGGPSIDRSVTEITYPKNCNKVAPERRVVFSVRTTRETPRMPDPEAPRSPGGVSVEVDTGVAVVTIDRPEARNAIGFATADELDAALDRVLAADAAVLVVRGGGDRAFVSGGDLKELRAVRTHDQAEAMARRIPTAPRPGRGVPRAGRGGAQRSRLRRRRRGRRRRRHPRRRARRHDRLQPGDVGDHAGVGRRRAARTARSDAAGPFSPSPPGRCTTPPRLSTSVSSISSCRAPRSTTWRRVARDMASTAPGTTPLPSSP